MKKLIVFIMSIFTSIAAMAQHEVNCTFTSITSNITTNTTLSSGTLYRIEGCIHVTNGHTLTIPAGTTVMFKKASASSLTIDEGAELVVNGTSGSPVIFTSDQTPGNKNYGDWNGLIIEGEGINNVSGGSVSVSGRTCTSLSGGGSNNKDNSGTIEYLRIEYASYGITMLSVGSGTTLDHIQTSFITNDAFEFYGGKPELRNIVSYDAKGNDFVFEYGDSALIQYAIALRDTAAHLSTGSNGLIIANDPTGTSNTPLTHPVVSDVAFIGPLYCGASGTSSDFKNAVLYELNAAGGVYNSIISGWPIGLRIQDNSTLNNADVNYTLNFAANSFFSNTTDFSNSGSWAGTCSSSMSDWLNDITTMSDCEQVGNEFSISPTGLSATLCGSFSSTPPSFILSTTGLSKADFLDAADLNKSFFTKSDGEYHGGLNKSTDWSATWSAWNPQSFNPCPGERMSNPTGVNNVTAENITGLKLAPNPSNGTTYAIFNAITDGNVTISLVDNAGRVLRTTQSSVTKGNQHIAVDTKGLAAGIYIIKVQSANNLMHAQLVVE